MKNSKSKTAIVTGTGRGIGLAIARAFAREGVRLVTGFWSGLSNGWKPNCRMKGRNPL
jgi:NAD(P)-dependent dehydrogenase (short-subunit alcohol dehydrogenase family)